MYGLLITFTSTVPADQLEVPFTEYAKQLNAMEGLLNKAWLHDGDTLGGFHLFSSQDAADAYLASDLAQGLMATEGFNDFEARGFDIIGGLTAMTGIAELEALAN